MKSKDCPGAEKRSDDKIKDNVICYDSGGVILCG